MTRTRIQRRFEVVSWGCLPIIAIAVIVWAGIAAGYLAVTR